MMLEDRARLAGIPWVLIGGGLLFLAVFGARWDMLVPALATLAVAGYLIWYLPRRIRRGSIELSRQLEPGLVAFGEGDLGRAADVFSAVARNFRNNKPWAGAAEQRLAGVLARQGDLARAIEVALDGERRASGTVRLPAAIQLAWLCALRGDAAAAERWSAEGRKRLSTGVNRVANEAALRQAELILIARSGRSAEAAAALDRDWHRLEESLTGATMKGLWLIRAFVAAEGPRSAMPPLLIRKGELAWIAAEWPELRAFMDAHDL